MHSTQDGLVLNLLTGSILPQYYVVFDDMFSTVVSSTAIDPEVCIRLVTSKNSIIQVRLDPKCDPYLDDYWLTCDDQLTNFIKSGCKILERVRVSETTFLEEINFLRNI